MCVHLPPGAKKRRHEGSEALRTSSRRTAAAAVAQIPEDEPVRCFCGAAEFDHSFVRFPMLHVSRCRNCGLESRAELKIAPVGKKAALQPPGAQPPVGFPPFWY
jgi:hypothetical protein